MGRVLAIDGNSLLNRGYYAVPYREHPGVVPRNAILGFVNMMLKNIENHSPTCVVVAFDVHAPTFRHKLYTEYKAGRHKTPEDLLAQFPILKTLLDSLGIQMLEKAGFEADDIIGTVARLAEEKGDECSVLTGDRDALQLITPHTIVVLQTLRETIYDEERMQQEYGLTAQQFIDYKTLMGDSSDNIKGANGIGEKTALRLLQKYNNIETIYDNLDELRPRERESLEEFRSIWKQTKHLVTIDKEVDINFEHREFSFEQLQSETSLKAFVDAGVPSFAERLRTPIQEEEQLSWFE